MFCKEEFIDLKCFLHIVCVCVFVCVCGCGDEGGISVRISVQINVHFVLLPSKDFTIPHSYVINNNECTKIILLIIIMSALV